MLKLIMGKSNNLLHVVDSQHTAILCTNCGFMALLYIINKNNLTFVHSSYQS